MPPLPIKRGMNKQSLFMTIFFTLAFSASAHNAHATLKVIDVDEEFNYNDPWYKKSKSDEENFKFLVNGLRKSPTGVRVLEKAREKAAQQGLTLFDVLATGDGSLTDTTLVRRFQASNPTNVVYETKSKVYLNRHLKTLDALLDFAHELTHFTYREPFNPYDSRFHLKDFIKSTVEGRGGEVDAFMVECKVLKELSPGEGFMRSSCPKILDAKLGVVSKELGVQEFYKVGHHYSDLKKDFQKFALKEEDLPLASSGDALFISSAWGLPYPVAAVKEYVNIMDRVCKNDKNRITLMQEKISRTPASPEPSIEANKSTQDFRLMFEDFKSRCDKFADL